MHLAEYPGLQVQQMNATLPIENLSPEYTQVELRLRPGGGECAQGSPKVIGQECQALEGPDDVLDHVVLWRNDDDLAAQLVRDGAVDVVSEDFMGRTDPGSVFFYRLFAVTFAESSQRAASPMRAIVERCGGRHVDLGGQDALVLMDGEEPHVALVSAGDTEYLVQTRIASTDIGTGKISDTRSGLPPRAAVDTMMRWWKAEVDALPPVQQDEG